MKVAVIGCGSMGTVHAHNYAKLPQVELVGVCDINEKSATALAERTGTRPFFTLESMIAEVNPDVISVCLPTPMHKSIVLQIAEYKKHIVCEKPLAPSLADAQEMIDACEKNGVRLFVGHVVRFFPDYVDLNNKFKAGVVGDVGVVHTKRSGSHPGRARDWYKHSAGGVILDLVIHDIDFVRGLLGEVSSVFAMNRVTDEMDYALLTLKFENGAIANLEGFWGYPGPFYTTAEVAGKKGILRADSRRTGSLQIQKSSTSQSGPAVVAIPRSASVNDPYYYELKHYIECIISGEQPIVTAHDAYKAVEIALAAAESIRTGMPVNIKQFAATQGGSEDGR